MAWATPQYSKRAIDRAGRLLADADEEIESDELNDALEVLNNFRAVHSFPLNTFQMRLRTVSTSIYPSALVAQRLKRVPSILSKLRRFPSMKLSQMQDIGGCRAVVNTVSQARRLVQQGYLRSRLNHVLVNNKDYVGEPKDSGYRGYHLIYRYVSDKKPTYNGCQIELQVRSRIQHAWATAVETVGTFIQHSLKSSEGPDEWLRFFALCSSAFARTEGTPLAPNTPTNKRELNRTIRRMATELDVGRQLRAYGAALNITMSDSDAASHYYILALDTSNEELRIYAYPKNQLTVATRQYLEIEKKNREMAGAEAVLVSADSLQSLRRAYPNYYLDTGVFLRELTQATEE